MLRPFLKPANSQQPTATSQPLQIRVALSGQMQEERLQGAELFSVAVEGAVAGEYGDVSLPDQLAGTGDDGDAIAEPLDRFENMAGDEDRPALFGKAAQPLLHEGDAGGI